MPIDMIPKPMMRDVGMTVDGFKEWLKEFDANNDGRISKHELREALLRRHGGARWLATWRSGRAVHHADKNHNGFVDDAEMENLVAFARKELGLRIYGR